MQIEAELARSYENFSKNCVREATITLLHISYTWAGTLPGIDRTGPRGHVCGVCWDNRHSPMCIDC